MVVDGLGRPVRMVLSAGQTSDEWGSKALAGSLPAARWMLADRSYDSNLFRNSLKLMGIEACIPSRKVRRVPIPHDREVYRRRHRIENTFARIKDWRRVAMRYDRSPAVFLSACALAAIVMFWL